MNCRMHRLLPPRKNRSSPHIDVCPKKAVHFYRVSNNIQESHWQSIRNHIYGFCDECHPVLLANGWKSGYKQEGTVRQFFGTVASCEAISQSEALGSRNAEYMEYLKHQFKKMFRLKMNRKVQLAAWPELLREALDEWVIESVQND